MRSWEQIACDIARQQFEFGRHCDQWQRVRGQITIDLRIGIGQGAIGNGCIDLPKPSRSVS